MEKLNKLICKYLDHNIVWYTERMYGADGMCIRCKTIIKNRR